MKVLLIVFPNQKQLPPIIPLGALYIANSLAGNGIEYDLLDLNFTANIAKSLVRKLENQSPDIVGISVRNIAETRDMNDTYDHLIELVDLVQHYSKVILGGAGFSIFPERIMEITQANYGIAGTGETAMIHIINHLDTVQEGSIIRERDDGFLISDISGVLEKYWRKYQKYFIFSKVAIPIQAVRGCNQNCHYCSYPILSDYVIQKRPIEMVIKEIAHITEFTDGLPFYFVDSVFNLDLNYTKKLLRAIIGHKLEIQWSCCINPVHFDDEMLLLMKKSGCMYCEAGVDSFSDFRLRVLGKRFDPKRARALIEGLQKNELSFSISLIMGGYGETEQTLKETIGVVNNYENATINVFLGERVYPRTPLARKLGLCGETDLFKADKGSIYIESAIMPLLESIIQNASPDRWNFAGEAF